MQEYMVVCDSDGDKPLVLLAMMTALNFQATVCFTASVEATHRYAINEANARSPAHANTPACVPGPVRALLSLYRLMQLIGTVPVAKFSSELTQTERNAILQSFRTGETRLYGPGAGRMARTP